jgi:hypothetical protein
MFTPVTVRSSETSALVGPRRQALTGAAIDIGGTMDLLARLDLR